MKKLFLKVLLFSCTILLFNCQSEDLNKDLENHSHEDTNRISFKDFLDKTEIKNFNLSISTDINSDPSTWRNQPNHNAYNNLIRQKLINFLAENPNATPQQCYTFLTNLIQQAKQAIINNPNVHLNNLNF